MPNYRSHIATFETIPNISPSTSIMRIDVSCKSGYDEAHASETVMQRYPLSTAVRSVELTHTSVVMPHSIRSRTPRDVSIMPRGVDSNA